MFIHKKGHQPGVYVPLRALFLVIRGLKWVACWTRLYHRLVDLGEKYTL